MDPERASSKRTVAVPLHVNRPDCPPMLEAICGRGFGVELRGDARLHEGGVVLAMTCKKRGIRMNYKLDFVLESKMLVELKGCPPQ